MSFNKTLAIGIRALAAVLALAAGALVPACKSTPDDPRQYLPGQQTYYNEGLGFSLRYPAALNLKVEDRGVAGTSDIALELEFAGTGASVMRLGTHDPALAGHVRLYLVAGSESAWEVGGEPAQRFEVEDQGADEAGATLQHVTVERGGRLFVFTGKGDTFEDVLASVEFF